MMSDTLDGLTLGELIQRVATDTDGAIRDRATARIRAKSAQVKAVIDGGVSPAEYQVLSKVHDALETSGHVVMKSWALAKHQREKNGR